MLSLASTQRHVLEPQGVHSGPSDCERILKRLAGLFFSALAVSGAVLLILEMYTPFAGLIQVSSAPLRAALAHLGQ